MSKIEIIDEVEILNIIDRELGIEARDLEIFDFSVSNYYLENKLLTELFGLSIFLLAELN